MRKILFILGIALSLTSCMGMPWVFTASSERSAHSERNAPHAPRDSVLLGELEVDFKADHDTIFVRNHEGSFRSLSFTVERNDIELFNIVVEFGNGKRQEISTRLIFNEGSRSRLINLDGEERRIQSIRFFYRTVGTRREGKAHVVVYGMK